MFVHIQCSLKTNPPALFHRAAATILSGATSGAGSLWWVEGKQSSSELLGLGNNPSSQTEKLRGPWFVPL